jgi:hypothetical protein
MQTYLSIITDRVRITETLIGHEFISRVQELERCGAAFFRIKCDKTNGVYEVQCDVPCRGMFVEEIELV